ncbi:hypothetical protein [Lysobacter gummosus]
MVSEKAESFTPVRRAAAVGKTTLQFRCDWSFCGGASCPPRH